MTGTKRLSLHGRLRMAAACPDPNAALLAEAADAIEQHEAFRLEVSDALKAAINDPDIGPLKALERFIVADPLEEALRDAACDLSTDDFAEALRAAIAKRGGKIVWENSDA